MQTAQGVAGRGAVHERVRVDRARELQEAAVVERYRPRLNVVAAVVDVFPEWRRDLQEEAVGARRRAVDRDLHLPGEELLHAHVADAHRQRWWSRAVDELGL